jgi:protein SCO1/2
MRRLPLLIGLTATVLAVAMLGVYAFATFKSAPQVAAAKPAVGGPFTLVDTTGKTFTNKDLLGKPTAIFFGYTYCPDVCPTTLTDLTQLMQQMGKDADKLNVVFVTIDPARDTPSKLKDYLSSFDPRIRGLSGTDAQVARIAKAYHVYYNKVPAKDGDYTMDHSALIYMMNAKGDFVGTLDYQEDQKSSLAKLERLVSGNA